MLLRNSLSSTRKFFQRTLGSLKSLFSSGNYQKLPKSPLGKPFSGSATTAGYVSSRIQQTSLQGMEKLYAENTTEGDHVDDYRSSSKTNPENKKIIKKNEVVITKTKADPLAANNCEECSRELEGTIVKKNNNHNYNIFVEHKLKELEMLDKSNVDHVLDIEEVLHYYSRVTCPAYLDIVDKFFAEILAEFFGSSTPVQSVNSKLRFNLEKI